MAAIWAGGPVAAPAANSCGRIDYEYPGGKGGASAIRIRAVNIRCKPARRVVRGCVVHERLKRGWRVRKVADRSAWGEHVLLTSRLSPHHISRRWRQRLRLSTLASKEPSKRFATRRPDGACAPKSRAGSMVSNAMSDPRFGNPLASRINDF